MELLHERCAGLDVHKDTVVACVRVAGPKGKATSTVQTFGTTTAELLKLSDWLTAQQVTHVVMESTGVYWRPVWHVLDGHVELVLANAGHVRNVPGRKSDVSDATWLADLLAHGLVRSSFVPPQPIQDMRELTRTRKQLVREVAQHTQRLQKVLEDANIKLASVLSDIRGVSGKLMVNALIDGVTDPATLAAFAVPRVKATQDTLRAALRGKVTAHHRFLLRLHRDQADRLDDAIADIDRRITDTIGPFVQAEARLKTIPGISATAARVIIAEVGIEMTRFPTAGHLVSWAGLCPRMDETAGRKRNTHLCDGDNWLKTVLVQCGWAAIRTRTGADRFKTKFAAVKNHSSAKKAVIAVAATILKAVHYILGHGVDYADLPRLERPPAAKNKAKNGLVRRLQELGYDVQLQERAAA